MSLQEAGLPLAVCIQLQECKLSLEQAQWTAKQTTSGFSVSLFWPEQRTSGGGVKQPARLSKNSKRHKPKRRTHSTPSRPSSNVQLPGSSAQAQSSHPLPVTLTDAHPTPQASATAIPVSADHDQADDEVSPDLLHCDSVRYEMQNDVPGVKYSELRGDEEEWTPVIRRRKKKRILKKEDSGSSSEESCDEFRMIKFAKEVRYRVQDGVPGLRIRRGNTNHSWTPISPSPVANRTRSRIKD